MKDKVLILGDLILDIDYVLKENKHINSSISSSYIVQDKSASFGGVGRIIDAFINGLKFYNYTLITAIDYSHELEELILCYERQKMNRNHIYQERNWITPKKIRFYRENDITPFLRIDKELNNKCNESKFKSALYDELSSEQYKVVLLCDYGKGTISNELYDYILNLKETFDFILIVDTKYKKSYKNCDILKTNINEFNIEWCSCEESKYTLNEKIISVALKYGISNIIITQNKKGAIFYSDGNIIIVPTIDSQKKSYIGAGDYFTAAFIKEYLDNSTTIKSMVKEACYFASTF